jgi:hypothetical protein
MGIMSGLVAGVDVEGFGRDVPTAHATRWQAEGRRLSSAAALIGAAL